MAIVKNKNIVSIGKDVQKLGKIEVSHYPAVLFLGIYPKELKARSQRDIALLFIAVLFKNSQEIEPVTCSLTYVFIYMHIHIYTGIYIYISAHMCVLFCLVTS